MTYLVKFGCIDMLCFFHGSWHLTKFGNLPNWDFVSRSKPSKKKIAGVFVGLLPEIGFEALHRCSVQFRSYECLAAQACKAMRIVCPSD